MSLLLERGTHRRAILGSLALIAVQGIALAQRPERPLDPPAIRPALRGGGTDAVVQRGPWSSVQVNVDASAANIPGDAANEPSIAIDPTDPDRVVIGWRQFDSTSSNFRQNGWSYSRDGGLSWSFPGAIEAGQFNSDPVLDTDSSGNFYYLSYPGGRTLKVFKSANAGLSWNGPTLSAGGDKPWMAIDRSGGIGDGNIYLIWQVLHGPQTFTRSTDGGASFSAALTVPGTPTFGVLAVAPNGDLYAAGRDGRSSSRYVLARSTDARDPARTPSFQSTQVDLGGSMGLGTGPNPVGLLGQVQVAVDPARAGHVYMLCSVDPAGSDPMDVHFVRSTDGGQSFGTPQRINDDPTGGNAWQWFGTLAVAPDGRLDAVWNDTRASAVVNLSETMYAYSLDGGQNWSPSIPVSPVWDSFLGFPRQNKIGDYYDMISDSAAANLAYAATFNGEQDVYFLRLGDCDDNGVHDGQDIARGSSADANGNGVPDRCESCQRDLGHGSTLVMSICGDALDRPGSRATLRIESALPRSPALLLLSLAANPSPIPLPGGGAFLPDMGIPASFVVDGLATDSRGQAVLTLGGGSYNRTRIYVQAVMLDTQGLQVSNALELDIGA